MPDTTACMRCHRVGFVRVERTIKARRATVDYYCGSCNQSWSLPQDDGATPQARLTASAAIDPPEPSRSGK